MGGLRVSPLREAPTSLYKLRVEVQTPLFPEGREDPETFSFIGAMLLKLTSPPPLAHKRSLRVNSAPFHRRRDLVGGPDLDVELRFLLRAAPETGGLFDPSLLHDLSLNRRKSDWVLSSGNSKKISTKGIFFFF